PLPPGPSGPFSPALGWSNTGRNGERYGRGAVHNPLAYSTGRGAPGAGLGHNAPGGACPVSARLSRLARLPLGRGVAPRADRRRQLPDRWHRSHAAVLAGGLPRRTGSHCPPRLALAGARPGLLLGGQRPLGLLRSRPWAARLPVLGQRRVSAHLHLLAARPARLRAPAPNMDRAGDVLAGLRHGSARRRDGGLVLHPA